MKLASIDITDFLGVRAVHARLGPVTLLCGPNAAGKSSIRDAVALALTADLGRVSLKKEAGQLVRAGAASAVCSVTTADGDEWRVTIKAGGQITDSAKGREPDPATAYALDGQRFARMPADERRRFLFGLMGVKTDAQEITHRLMARQLDKARVDRVVPLLRSGFDAAEAEARRKATEARGAWKAVTGEAYGSQKAAAWKAEVPAYDAAALKRLSTEIEHADVAIGQWREQVGKLQAEHQRRAELQAKLPALAESGALVPRIGVKLDIEQGALNAAELVLADAEVAAGGDRPRVGLVHDLARALHAVATDPLFAEALDLSRINPALSAYEREHGPLVVGLQYDPEAAARLPELRAQRDLMQRAVTNTQRDLAAALDAQAEHDRITAELAETFDAAALGEAREQIEQLQAQRAAKEREAAALRTAKAAAEAAAEKTREATRHAADVGAWEAIAEHLDPSGIPADLLREALGPIHERLQQHAADTGWPLVEVQDDMRITAGGRDYRLLSESERWRADAMLAEAIAHLSGVRLLVLDRMDVLDLQGRSDLLGWLETLADLGEIDTALVFATLKAAPAALPAHITAHWIEGGMLAPTVEPVAEAA